MIVCKYCCKGREKDYFECYRCGEFVHPRCVKDCSVPGNLMGDVFFSYTCKDCSCDGLDKLERDKMAWVDVVLLALYNLTQTSMNQSFYGFFHWNKHIKRFVDNHWKILFPYLKTKRKSYRQMITCALKNYSPEYFTCGDGSFDFPCGLTGWYKLTRPDILPADALLQRREKKKRRRLEPDSEKFCDQNEESSWCDTSSHETDNFPNSTVSSFPMFRSDHSVHEENMYSRSYVKPSASLSEYLFAEEDAATAEDVDIDVTDSDSVVDIRCREILSRDLNLPEATKPEAKIKRESLDGHFRKIKTDVGDQAERNPFKKKESLFEKNQNPEQKPWVNRRRISNLSCDPLYENEENYLSYNLGKRIFESKEVSLSDIRLYRKLRIRKLKRERNMPVFDLRFSEGSRRYSDYRKENGVRILDRYYQHQTVFSAGESELDASFRTRLMGHTEQFTCFRSPFTQRLLKPFIRRDYESAPLWLKLLEELRSRTSGNEKKIRGSDFARAPIDYSYVRPQHIPAVNSLACQYFWPGINLSECLQYPDFSCVVLYKKLIVAFAFLVPDVGYNEAYISFIFTRPEWRRAGIGTFMLYHLIQTCMGRDITLHVSATNSALFLYQRFGFKVEEFVQDFYEKYLPADSNECKHAFFLRLAR